MSKKKIAKLLLRVTVTSVLLALVFRRIQWENLADSFQSANWRYMPIIWAASLLLCAIRSLRFYWITKQQELDSSFTTIFAASTITRLYGLIMPGLLSSSVKWYILKKDTGKGTSVFSCMFYNQFIVFFSMLSASLMTILFLNPASILLKNTRHTWLLPPVCAGLLFLVVVFASLMLNPRSASLALKFFSFLIKSLPRRIHDKLILTLQQITDFQKVPATFHLKCLSLVFIADICGSAGIYFLAARAVNITVPFITFIFISSTVYVIGQIPIFIANLGLREFTLVGFLSVYGAGEPDALLMSILIFSASIFMALIGAGFQLTWKAPGQQSSNSI